MSEVWFYPVTFGWGLLELCVYDGAVAYLCWLVLARFGAKGVACGFIAACLFGFLIEGVPVGHVYTALPFTLVWPDIFTHWNRQLTGWGMFIGGHVALNMSARHSVRPAPCALRPATWDLPFFAMLIAVMFAVQNAWMWFAASLILPPLVARSVWLIWRARGPQPATGLVTSKM